MVPVLERPPRSAVTPLAVSRRQARQLLGCRAAIIAELVRRGLLREVPWGADGRRRIPLESVQQLARTGWRLDGPAPRRRPSRRAGQCDPAALRSLDVEALAAGRRS